MLKNYIIAALFALSNADEDIDEETLAEALKELLFPDDGDSCKTHHDCEYEMAQLPKSCARY